MFWQLLLDESLPFLQKLFDSVVAFISEFGIEMAFANFMIKNISDVMPSKDEVTLTFDDDFGS